MKFGSNAAGQPPAKKKAIIVRVEQVDEDGAPLIPPMYEYWVVIPGNHPEVKAVASSYQQAYDALLELGLDPHP